MPYIYYYIIPNLALIRSSRMFLNHSPTLFFPSTNFVNFNRAH